MKAAQAALTAAAAAALAVAAGAAATAGGGGGGGGGSFIAPDFTNTFGTDGENSGNGFVSIDEISGAVPEASTWAMMLAGFTGLGALALRKKKTKLA
jgi:hypothetical protein